MKEKTIQHLQETLNDIKASGLSISDYCIKEGKKAQAIYDKMGEFKKSVDTEHPLYSTITTLYEEIKHPVVEEKSAYTEPVDTGNYTEVNYERDEKGKILYYDYKIYRKGKNPLVGKLSRDEMNIIYRLYSYYGASLTQREVSRYFPELSLVDFKRILSAFNIYKASAPFAPHIIEETDTEELRNMQIREKENDFLKKIEEDRIKSNERLLKKYAVENEELKSQLDNVKGLQFNLVNFPQIKINKVGRADNKFINLYIADMHIGAAMESGTIYKENINYGGEEALRRLNSVIEKLTTFGTFHRINVCLMGDMVDCCGPTNKTARLDHSLPENMDGFEQANTYISVITAFIQNLAMSGICNDIRLYSVRCGNHSGPIEYVATRALFAELKLQGFKATLFNSFLGYFREGEHYFCLTHGKDSAFMKKGLPLNIDDKNKVLMYEWLDNAGVPNDGNTHVIKGDLHSSNYSACKRFDYRNVLSLFGASDYSAYNFSSNGYGLSYDVCIGENLMRGEFQNM